MKKGKNLSFLFIISLIILIILAIYIRLLFFIIICIFLIYYVIKSFKRKEIIWKWGIKVSKKTNPFAYWITITILIIIILICIFAIIYFFGNLVSF